MAVRYEMPQFLLRSTVLLFCNGTGKVCWYAVWICLLNTFYVQRAAVNEDSCDRARRALSQRCSQVIIITGGVEGTRLEAKAKDTKKIRGQGQPFRGQALSRPRTKDTAASVLQKKKVFKSFSGNLQFIGIARIFDWGGLNYKSRAMTSSKICLLALYLDFAKGEGLN